MSAETNLPLMDQEPWLPLLLYTWIHFVCSVKGGAELGRSPRGHLFLGPPGSYPLKHS